MQHYNLLHARCLVDHYVGRPEAAWERIMAAYPQLKGSMLLRIQIMRTLSSALYGSTALAVDDLGRAERASKRLYEQGTEMAQALGTAISAGVTRRKGDDELALKRVTQAETSFEAIGMRHHVTAARLARARWMGGEEGTAVHAAATQALRDDGVVDVNAFGRMIFPGLI